MYTRYAERQGWKIQLLDLSESGIGGIKEVSAIIDYLERQGIIESDLPDGLLDPADRGVTAGSGGHRTAAGNVERDTAAGDADRCAPASKTALGDAPGDAEHDAAEGSTG